MAGLAAALAIGVGVWLNSPWRAPRPEPSRVAQSAAAIRRLPDGSILELNGGARIAVKFEPARRLVELEAGEALFHVEKDSARPFVVRVAGVDVRAVGTAFSVKLEGAAVEVLVTEGRVGVEEETGGPSLLPVASADAAAVLVAGQRLRVEPPPVSGAPRQVLVTAVGAAEMKERLAWRIPRFEFEGIELADAAARLNQLNRRQITLEGAGVGHLRISGTFYPDDPNTFARLTAASLGLLVEERNEHEIVLRSK